MAGVIACPASERGIRARLRRTVQRSSPAASERLPLPGETGEVFRSAARVSLAEGGPERCNPSGASRPPEETGGPGKDL